MALAVPGVARAQSSSVELDGSPLNVFVDGIGGLQVNFDGNDFGEFYGEATVPSGDGLALRSGNANTGYEVSQPDENREVINDPVVTGPVDGTRTVTSDYSVWTLNSDFNQDVTLHVVETATYTDGAHDVHLHFGITNVGEGLASFSVGELADLYVGDSDSGVGAFDPGPPRFIGGTGDLGGVDGLLEVAGSEWTHFEEAIYSDVFDDFAAGGLKDTWLTTDEDNGVGAEWAIDDLAPGDSVTKDVIWRFNPPSGPPPPHIFAPPPSDPNVTLIGTAQPNDLVTVFEGSTPVGSTRAGSDGSWTVALHGVPLGSHTYTAVATDAAGDQSEPSAPVTVSVDQGFPFQPTPTPVPTPVPTPQPQPQPQQLPPPEVGEQVNAQTRSGTVRIRLPGTHKFIVLGPGKQIPTGTVVDARKGRMTLTTAVPGGTEHADFYKGVFKVTQSDGRKPLTTLRLAGRKPTCGSKRHAKAHHATAARKRRHGKHHKKRHKRVKSRRLWGSGHGAFRTKGQYSSATVRGTTWLTRDSCAGTLTRVTHGVVRVRDFRRHKSILVRAGHHYLARAKGHHKHHHH